MHYQKSFAVPNGLTSLKALLVANGYAIPSMWADELFYEAPGANWTTPNTLDIAIGPNSMAALDDGDRIRPGESNRYSPGTGKVDLTQISIFAPDGNQRIKLTINTQ